MIKCRREVLGFDDRMMMLIGIPLVSVMVNFVLFSELIKSGEYSTFGKCHFIALIYTFLYWITFREIHFYFATRYQDYRRPFSRYIRMIPAVFVLYIIFEVILSFTVNPLLHGWFDKVNEPLGVTKMISSFLFLALIMTIYETKHLAYKLRISLIEKEQLINENISSQLEGLRNQVNPHFLFNSLNTLSSIIPEDPDRAIRFVSKMSKVYRYILEIKDQEIIPLREELEFLDSYTFMLKERFGKNITVLVTIPESFLDQYVVPLSLQITFENAIKHNIISNDKPLLIEVYVDKDSKLVVRNNLQKKQTIDSSTKVGLQNIKNRYRFFTNTTVDVVSTLKHFMVSLPLLENQTVK